MPHSITAEDLRAVAEVQRILLTCPMPQQLDRWRTEVNRRVRALVGADRCFFMLPNHTSVTCLADIPYELDLETYPQITEPYWTAYGVWERAVHFGVATRRMIYGRYARHMRRSAYYNDGVVPARAYDAVSMTLPAEESCFVQLTVHHDRPFGRKFGQREFALLQAVYPAFEAGTRAYGTLERRLRSLPQLLDRGHDGICLFGMDGCLLHANPAASALLGDPRYQIQRHVLELVSTLRGPVTAERAPPRPITVDGPKSPITLGGSYLEAGVVAPHRLIMVFLRTGARLPACTPDDLRARFGLTRQQARVALLLAQRRTNREISERLCISVHTTKRHVEQVLAKLGVGSRGSVERVLLANQRAASR